MVVELRDVWFRYPGRSEFTIKGIDLSVERGEFILITGPTGSGKSTLISLINGLIPHHIKGFLKGSVRVLGRDTSSWNPRDMGRFVGTVFQNPEEQLVSYRVEEEVRFPLENFGFKEREIEKRVERALREAGLWDKRNHKVDSLSGGEKQRLALASVLSYTPELVLLDEPTSHLDKEGRKSLLDYLSRIKGKVTLIVVEHRTRDLEELADRVLFMENGRFTESRPEDPVFSFTPKPKGEELLSLKDIHFSYEGGFSLGGISLSFSRGEVVALLGPNGSGKSTLLKLTAGLLKPRKGKVVRKGRVSMLLQNPDLMLIWDTVRDELLFFPRNLGVEGMLDPVVKKLGLEEMLNDHPFSLSRGQRIKVALGSILTSGPRILLLDEPTTGQDRRSVASLMKLVVDFGDLVIYSTHHEDVAEAFSTRVVVMEKGRVVEDVTP